MHQYRSATVHIAICTIWQRTEQEVASDVQPNASTTLATATAKQLHPLRAPLSRVPMTEFRCTY